MDWKINLAVLAALVLMAAGGVNKTVTIKPIGNKMQYATTEISAKAGSTLTIVFKNTATSSAMHHNVVVLTSSTAIETVGQAALTAAQSGYIPPKHTDKIIAHTAMSAPGETKRVTFTVPPPGKYPYICTFPGHYKTMRGTLTSVK